MVDDGWMEVKVLKRKEDDRVGNHSCPLFTSLSLATPSLTKSWHKASLSIPQLLITPSMAAILHHLHRGYPSPSTSRLLFTSYIAAFYKGSPLSICSIRRWIVKAFRERAWNRDRIRAWHLAFTFEHAKDMAPTINDCMSGCHFF